MTNQVLADAMDSVTMKRVLLAGLALVLLVLAYAWFDGGREPLRPIAKPIDTPEGWR